MPAARVVFNRFPQLAAAAEAEAARAVEETATLIEQSVKGMGPHPAPILTGNLRRSYHREMTGRLTAEVGNDPGVAPYAIFIEHGTSRMRAQPHLRPSADFYRDSFEERMRGIINGT